MLLIEGLLLFITILAIYLLLVIFLHKRGFLEKHNISLYGPALLLRTKRGINFLKRLAQKKRFWRAYGSFSIVFCLIMMVFLVAIFVWQAWSFLGLRLTPAQKEMLPGPEFVLILPGINPILPLEYIGYIIIALIVAIIVHEFSHGILTLASRLKVKSLGLLYLIFPIGAFVEPDEEQLKKTKKVTRMRVFATGPMSNFLIAFIVLLIFSFVFMSAVQPIQGVSVLSIGENTPAEAIGLTPGVVLTSINDTRINNVLDFYYTLQNTTAGQTINVSYAKQGITYHKKVILADKYNYTKNETYLGKGYLGVGPNMYSGFITALKNPFVFLPDSFILFYGLPILGYFWGYNPIVSPFTDSYIITGPLGLFPTSIFWIIVNILYWIFWLNLAVGMFNVLPIVPLDGGFLFGDALRVFIERVKRGVSEEQREKIVKNISLVVSLVVLLIVLFPLIIKYI